MKTLLKTFEPGFTHDVRAFDGWPKDQGSMWHAIYHEILRLAKRWGGASAPGRRTQITIETDQVLIIGRRRAVRRWCLECGREAEMVNLNSAAALGALRMTKGAPEAAKWHWFLSEDGALLICLNSVLGQCSTDRDRNRG